VPAASLTLGNLLRWVVFSRAVICDGSVTDRSVSSHSPMLPEPRLRRGLRPVMSSAERLPVTSVRRIVPRVAVDVVQVRAALRASVDLARLMISEIRDASAAMLGVVSAFRGARARWPMGGAAAGADALAATAVAAVGLRSVRHGSAHGPCTRCAVCAEPRRPQARCDTFGVRCMS
jgi:hypothetical protein